MRTWSPRCLKTFSHVIKIFVLFVRLKDAGTSVVDMSVFSKGEPLIGLSRSTCDVGRLRKWEAGVGRDWRLEMEALEFYRGPVCLPLKFLSVLKGGKTEKGR